MSLSLQSTFHLTIKGINIKYIIGDSDALLQFKLVWKLGDDIHNKVGTTCGKSQAHEMV